MKIIVCGDIVNYKNSDGLICSEEVSSYIRDSDIAIANFEAPVHSNGKSIEKSGGHHSQVKNTLKGLKTHGFDTLCLANNHIMDYGEVGLKETLEEAKKNNLKVIGAGLCFDDAYKPLIVEKDGLKIGIINAGEAQFGALDYYTCSDKSGYAWINHSKIDSIVKSLKEKCDYIIFNAHCGLENVSVPQLEWRLRYKQLCDIGVDVLIGTHPHVPQGYEKYNDSIIFYSLGNFYFDSKNFEDKTDNSYSVVIHLGKEKFSYEFLYHSKSLNSNKVVIDKEKAKVNIEGLNAQLTDNYEARNLKISQDIFNTYIKRNTIYSYSKFFYDGNLLSSIKRFIKSILGKSENKENLALHLLRNESYYYAAKTVLNYQYRRKG